MDWLRFSNPSGRARQYYVVEQVQDGLWYQVGHFTGKADAERFRERLPGRTRTVHTYPGHDYPVRATNPRSPNRGYARQSNPAGRPDLKPLVIEKAGRKWHLYLNMPGAVAYGGKGPRMKMYPADEMVPIVKTEKGVDLVSGGTPAKLSKEQAQHLAHKIGRYMFGFGDFVSAYTSGY